MIVIIPLSTGVINVAVIHVVSDMERKISLGNSKFIDFSIPYAIAKYSGELIELIKYQRRR